MSNTHNNTGINESITIYVENKALGGTFKKITDFECEDQYDEGEDSYLGQEDVETYKRYKNTTGSFTTEESNASQAQSVQNGIDTAEIQGKKPNIVIVRTTRNADGTLTKQRYEKCTLKHKYKAGSRTEKTSREWSWAGSKVRT